MMKLLLEGLWKYVILILSPVDSSAFFEDIHILILEKPDIFFEENIWEAFPIVLIVEGLNSTEFNITH